MTLFNGIIKPLVAYKLINLIAKPVINQAIILLLVFTVVVDRMASKAFLVLHN